MSMTKEEMAKARLLRFQEAKKKAEAEASAKSGYIKEDIPEFETCVLNKGVPKIIRLLGNSPLMRDKDTDPIIVKRSMCIDDDGHYATVILSDDKDHPINVLFRTILGKYKFDKDTKVRTYYNAGKPSFERFMYNGKPKEKRSAYERGMQPETYYLFNCIDKTDNWCAENKHSKLLCWDSSVKEIDGKNRTYYTYGVKPSFYTNVFDEKCTEFNRMFDEFDIVVMRLKEKKGDSYLTILTPEQKMAINNLGLDFSKVTMDYLTDDEESYGLYKLEDIPFISRPTSCTYFLKVFSKLIKQADMDFNNGEPILYNLFIKAKEEESAKFKAKKEEMNSKTVDSSVETDSVSIETKTVSESDESVEDDEGEDLPTEVETPSEPTVVTKKVIKSAKFDPLAYKHIFPYVEELNDDELSHIIGYDESTGQFKFNSSSEVCECPCGADVEMNQHICHKCGSVFES